MKKELKELKDFDSSTCSHGFRLFENWSFVFDSSACSYRFR
jgi:hypothetical protein